MLNELAQVVTALERVGVVTASRHPRMKPMSKNRELLIVRLDGTGLPADLELTPVSANRRAGPPESRKPNTARTIRRSPIPVASSHRTHARCLLARN